MTLTREKKVNSTGLLPFLSTMRKKYEINALRYNILKTYKSSKEPDPRSGADGGLDR